jgi:hypothetical protein
VTGRSLRPTRALRLAGSALAAGVLALGFGGCSLSIGGLQNRTISYTIGSRVTTLIVTDHAGDVHVTGGTSTSVSVTEHISFHGTAPTTAHGTAGGTLSLTSHCPGTETCTVDYTIAVPRTTTVRVTDAAGSVILGSLAGPVTVHVNAGKISLNSLAGSVDATSNAGSIHGQRLSSRDASMHVTAGEINVSFSAPPVAIAAITDVGAITVRVPDTVHYHVTASATVGDVRVSVSRSTASMRTIKATTRTGSITIEPSA